MLADCVGALARGRSCERYCSRAASLPLHPIAMTMERWSLERGDGSWSTAGDLQCVRPQTPLFALLSGTSASSV